MCPPTRLHGDLIQPKLETRSHFRTRLFDIVKYSSQSSYGSHASIVGCLTATMTSELCHRWLVRGTRAVSLGLNDVVKDNPVRAQDEMGISYIGVRPRIARWIIMPERVVTVDVVLYGICEAPRITSGCRATRPVFILTLKHRVSAIRMRKDR